MKIAQAKPLLADLKKLQKKLLKSTKELPDSDAYASVYCILVDCANNINLCLEDLVPFLKEANKDFRKNPDQGGNHAKAFMNKENKNE
jgi:hypothetical protein